MILVATSNAGSYLEAFALCFKAAVSPARQVDNPRKAVLSDFKASRLSQMNAKALFP
jgi:hypothetical protein